MIISNRAQGPSYSTDPVAKSLSAFTTTRIDVRSTVDSPRSTSPTGTLEDLYPSLFKVAQSPWASLARRVRQALASVVRPAAGALGQR